VWFTGLSGSGKSTLASALQTLLHKRNIRTYMLDGDNLRMGLNSDLDFSDESRKENIRRVSEAAKLFMDAGFVAICSLMENFVEIYTKCDIAVCEKRDVNGLYKKVRNGEIKNFTGIDSPYEEPKSADLIVDTNQLSIDKSTSIILDKLLIVIQKNASI